jgi:hypothetical protein
MAGTLEASADADEAPEGDGPKLLSKKEKEKLKKEREKVHSTTNSSDLS